MAAPKLPAEESTNDAQYRVFLGADELGLKLELTSGMPSWEFHPSPRHQIVLGRIMRGIKSTSGADKSCACLPISDMYIRFLDGSLKRPDIAIFCMDVPETDSPAVEIPAAVIEIISPGFEHKDLVVNPAFYLAQGVQDVVVVDPRALAIWHSSALGKVELKMPHELVLKCGCAVSI